MPEPLVSVVFRGEIAEGWEPSEVKRHMGSRLRMPESSVERFFSSPLVIIKNRVDRQTAANYVRAFASMGIICRLEAAPPTDATLDRVGLAWQGLDEDKSKAPNATTTVECPKCGHIQPPSGECSRCGIIFSKYRPDSGNQHGTSIQSARITFYDLAKGKKQLIWLGVLLSILGGLLYHLVTTRDIKHPPGILIASEPAQVIIKNPKAWRKGDRLIVPLAQFRLQARVLSSERYRFDSVADLSPIDLALGWGPMSDQKVLDQLEIGQGSRRFVVFPIRGGPPISMNVLLTCSSNMHMLPANDEIRDKLFSLRCGQLIALSGYLVGVQQYGQWTWVSSLSRTDTGDGACEIVWVERLEVR